MYKACARALRRQHAITVNGTHLDPLAKSSPGLKSQLVTVHWLVQDGSWLTNTAELAIQKRTQDTWDPDGTSKCDG